MHVWWDEKVCFWEGVCACVGSGRMCVWSVMVRWEEVCMRVCGHGEVGRCVSARVCVCVSVYVCDHGEVAREGIMQDGKKNKCQKTRCEC